MFDKKLIQRTEFIQKIIKMSYLNFKGCVVKECDSDGMTQPLDHKNDVDHD